MIKDLFCQVKIKNNNYHETTTHQSRSITRAAVIREALRDVFPQGQLPALTLIGVMALADKDFLIEIDAEVISETKD